MITPLVQQTALALKMHNHSMTSAAARQLPACGKGAAGGERHEIAWLGI